MKKYLRLDGNLLSLFEKICLFLFIFACLIFPASDAILSKKLLFCVCFLVYCAKLILRPTEKIINKKLLFRASFFILIPIIFSIPTFGNNTKDVVFFIFSTITILIVLCAEGREKELFRYFILAANCLSLITLIIVFMPRVSTSLSNRLINLFNRLSSGFIGVRWFGPIKLVMVHFRTAPVLIIPFSYYFMSFIDNKKLKDLFLLIFHFVAIVFTASRGIMLFSAISVYTICFVRIKQGKYQILFLLATGCLLAGFLYLFMFTNIFSKTETSNSIKINHIRSFFDLIEDNPLTLLFGNGTGSIYYTKGFGGYYFQTEVTYVDMIRYWGILVTILYTCNMVLPMYKNKLVVLVPFIFYFIDAATNPLIFCSTGMLIVSVYFLIQKKGFEV